MTKAYLLAYSHSTGSQAAVKQIVERMPLIKTWRYDMPNAFYIISESSARELAEAFREATGGKGRFLVTELTANSYGWLTPESWYLIQNHKVKPKPKPKPNK